MLPNGVDGQFMQYFRLSICLGQKQLAEGIISGKCKLAIMKLEFKASFRLFPKLHFPICYLAQPTVKLSPLGKMRLNKNSKLKNAFPNQ